MSLGTNKGFFFYGLIEWHFYYLLIGMTFR